MPRGRAWESFERIEEQVRLYGVLERAKTDPKALINEIEYFDPVTRDWVKFKMYPPDGWESPITRLHNHDLLFGKNGAEDWLWQSVLVDWIHDPELHAYLIYKARQLGITLIWCAYALWGMLFLPGATVAAYSYEETEAQKLTQATWDMFLRLPKILTQHVRVLSPDRSEVPSEWIRLKHADGRVSAFQALPASGPHGHGARVWLGIMDEVAKQRYARKIYEAIYPATISRGGKLGLISTAEGVSNLETGEGSFFHHLWHTRKEKHLRYVFLPWNAEPTRDEQWYLDIAMGLPLVERNRQYPLNENDGFRLSGVGVFDPEALAFYREEAKPPRFSGQFTLGGRIGLREGNWVSLADGIIDVWEKPKPGVKYGIGIDTSTGRAEDYTNMDVIDLGTAEIVAQLHSKIEAPRAAIQAHFLGKWYNTARIVVERGGGYGEALIIALRDGNNQLPPYPGQKLYRHTTKTRANQPTTEEYGFPMSPKNRPLVLERLKTWVRQRQFPWLPSGTVAELETFVTKDAAPYERAQDGCNDDRVMSLALAVMLFEKYGEKPADPKRSVKRTKNQYQPSPVRAG